MALYGEDAQAGAVAAPFTMDHRLMVNETEPRRREAIELHHGNRFGHATPGILERLGRKGVHAAFNEAALARRIDAKAEHARDGEVALDPLLKGGVAHG